MPAPMSYNALPGRGGSFPDLRAASRRQLVKHASATGTPGHRRQTVAQSLSRLLVLERTSVLNGARFIC
ncbi:mCG1034544 [Mus musculus]|nr:mCG1034544 [Mus musculus]